MNKPNQPTKPQIQNVTPPNFEKNGPQSFCSSNSWHKPWFFLHCPIQAARAQVCTTTFTTRATGGFTLSLFQCESIPAFVTQFQVISREH